MATTSDDQQVRLRHFWEVAVFTLGIFWGFANLVYCPVAAVTSVVGSSWFEGAVVFLGGLLTFSASIRAFYNRRSAARGLVAGGIVLLAVAAIGLGILQGDTSGIMNITLLYLAGGVSLVLGVFGLITDRRGWPPLR